jgi:HPt (histidine-containing phosphotransfer) domain-containing protein
MGIADDSSPVDEGDFGALLELLDHQTMREVIRMFTASAPERLAAAQQGIAAGDAAAVITAFHTLRSGCGQLGAKRLDDLCATAERAAKGGDLSAAEVQLPGVRAEYERCVVWFRERTWLSP